MNRLVRALAPMVEGRASLENPSTSLAEWSGWDIGSHDTDAGETVTAESALTVPAMLGVVQKMSRVVYNLPVKVYQRAADGSREIVEGDPRGAMLSRRGSANPELRAWRMRDMHVAHILLWGNAYAEIVRNGAGRPVELWPIGPWRVKPQRRGGRLSYVVTIPNGGTETFRPEDILHIPGLGWNGLEGRSVISYIRQSLGLSMAAERFGSRFFGAGARPSSIVTHPEALSLEAKEKLRRHFEQLYSGRGNSHRLALLDEGMQWQTIGVPPEDAQFLETRRLQVEDVARATGFPPHMLGLETPRSGSNLEEMNREFVTYTLSPWLTPFEAEWKVKLFDGEGLWAEHDLGGLLEGNAETQTETLRQRLVSGAITLNEWRRLDNRAPYPPEIGDVPMIQSGMVTIESQITGQGAPPDVGGMLDQNHTRSRPKWDQRASDALLRVREAFRPLFRDEAQRLMNRELIQLRRMLTRWENDGDRERFGDGVMELYEDQQQRVAEGFRPLVGSFASALTTVIERDLGTGRQLDPSLMELLDQYAEDMGSRWVSQNRSVILRNLNETEDAELARRLSRMFDRWEADRADSFASDEVVQSQGAVSRTAFALAGVGALLWNAGPNACPFCQRMDGRRVGTNTPFLTANDVVNADGETLSPSTTINHPPVHAGCDCFITPGF